MGKLDDKPVIFFKDKYKHNKNKSKKISDYKSMFQIYNIYNRF